MENYPLKKLPKKLDHWINENEFCPDFPAVEPKPKKESAKVSLGNENGCLNAISIFFSFGIIISLGKNYTTDFFLIVGFILIYIISRYSISVLNNNKLKKLNDALESKYSNDVKNYETKINKIRVNWENEKNLLSKKYNSYDKIEYLQDFIKYFSRRASEMNDKPSVGFSEAYFSGYLSKNFGNYVYNNLSLCIYNNGQYFHIYPDFLIYIPEYNFHLVIEIDEPYIINGAESHFRNIDKSGFNKDLRNEEYYSQSLWYVIRFSEDQIVEYPDSCCSEIYNFIKETYPSFQIQNFLFSEKTSIQHPSWNFEDCTLMKLNNHRSIAQNKLYEKNPFYGSMTIKFGLNNYTVYQNKYKKHLINDAKSKELASILKSIEKVNFDLEIEKNTVSSNSKNLSDVDDLPF